MGFLFDLCTAVVFRHAELHVHAFVLIIWMYSHIHECKYLCIMCIFAGMPILCWRNYLHASDLSCVCVRTCVSLWRGKRIVAHEHAKSIRLPPPFQGSSRPTPFLRLVPFVCWAAGEEVALHACDAVKFHSSNNLQSSAHIMTRNEAAFLSVWIK